MAGALRSRTGEGKARLFPAGPSLTLLTIAFGKHWGLGCAIDTVGECLDARVEEAPPRQSLRSQRMTSGSFKDT